MPSSRSCLLATWLYNDMASTPSSSPSLRIVSDPIPCSSANATATCKTRSRLSGVRGFVAGSVFGAISVPPQGLDNLTS